MRRAVLVIADGPPVLGIDPGARWVGWAVVAGSAWRACGVLDVTVLGRRGVVREMRQIAAEHRVRLVGVENVEEVNYRPGFGPRMAADLIASGKVGERLVQAFEDDGRDVVTYTAEAWHEHWFNQRAVKPSAVAALCKQQISGWPKKIPGVDAQQAGHARDAGGGALFAPLAPRV